MGTFKDVDQFKHVFIICRKMEINKLKDNDALKFTIKVSYYKQRNCTHQPILIQ